MDYRDAERLRAILKIEVDKIRKEDRYFEDLRDYVNYNYWSVATSSEVEALYIDKEIIPELIVLSMFYWQFADITDAWKPDAEGEELIAKLRAYRPDLVEKSNTPMDSESHVFEWLGVNFLGISAYKSFSWYLKILANDQLLYERASLWDDALLPPPEPRKEEPRPKSRYDDDIPF